MGQKVKLDLSWLGQQNATVQPKPHKEPPPPPEPAPPEPEQKILANDDNGIIFGREDDETFDQNEKKFEGPNADILSTPTQSSYINRVAEEAAKAPVEEIQQPIVPQQQQIRIFVLGGNDNYFRNTLEPLNSSTPDIKFVKQMPSDDQISIQAIEAVDPDIVMVWAKAGMADPLRFWNTINNTTDSNGKRYIDAYARRSVVAVIPNDITTEISMQDAGLSWFVRETNPQRHEVNIDAMIETIREAYNDIQNRETDVAPAISQEPPVPPVAQPQVVEQPQMVASETQEIVSQEVQQPIDSQIPPVASQEPVMQQQMVQQEPVIQQAPVQQQPIQQPMQQPVQQRVVERPIEQQPMVQPQPVVEEKPKYHLDMRTLSDRMQEKTTSQPAKVIGMYSVTGGAGTTTCAVNLAAILAKNSNSEINSDYRVLLLEYNLSCQCVDIFFGIKTGKKTIYELAKATEEYRNDRGEIQVDAERMKPIISQYVTHDDKTGLDILFGISVPLELDNINKGFTKSLFGALRRMYDVVIVDLNADMAKEPILDALEEIDTLYYIMPMDVASIRNTQQILPILRDVFNLTADKVKVVVNKVIENNREFDVDQIINLFAKKGNTIEGTIPYEEAGLISALNRGVPIAIEDPDHPVSQALHSFAVDINPMMNVSEVGSEEKPKKKGLFGGLFGGGKKKKDKKKEQKSSGGSSLFKRKPKKEEIPDEPQMDEEEEREEKPKKKGLFGGLFGGGKKKKKDKASLKKKRHIEEEEMLDEPQGMDSADMQSEDMEDEAPPKKKKQRTSLFSKLAGLFSFGGKKVGVKKGSRAAALSKGRPQEEDEGDEEPQQQQRQPRLVSRRRRAVRR